VVNPSSEQPQLCAARNSVTGILSVNPLGFYRQCSDKKDAGVIAEHEAGLNTVDRILVG